jgi:streptogramin lyase
VPTPQQPGPEQQGAEHDPSSVFAAGLKLHAAASVQPATSGAAKYNAITSSAVNALFQIPMSSNLPKKGSNKPEFPKVNGSSDCPEVII